MTPIIITNVGSDIELSFTNLWLASCMRGLFVILEISLGDKIFATIITNEVVEVDSKDGDAKEFFFPKWLSRRS